MVNDDGYAAGAYVKGIGDAQPGGNDDQKEPQIKRIAADFINAVCLEAIDPPARQPENQIVAQLFHGRDRNQAAGKEQNRR